ncbi:MAG: aminoglycoside phosphotransferase family protein [Alloprevotella sp.]|nr:aminoglycoside phosphotransferase family protein [Alloprevotella sp.]
MEQKELQQIASHFQIEGNIVEVKPLGNGLINTTYMVVTEGDAPNYVLQNINVAIFPDVELLMNNIVAVTGHIRAKLEAAGADDIDRKVLKFVPCQCGKFYYEHDGKFWRVMVFIPDTVSKSGVTPESSYIVGETFGDFQASLADIPAQLGESIKDFHNIEFRLQQLKEAMEADKMGRLAETKDIADELMKRAEDMTRSERLFREGKLPKRICHCDTKVDNILFDKDENVLCVIDLDTVMPSFVFSDYGDFLRSAANTQPEDSADYDKIEFRMDIFKAFTEGYLKTARAFLTPIEIENLPYGATLFPYMQTVRFYADYLNGDTYYKIQYPEHNLVRTKNQLTLLQRAEAHIPEMEAFIKEQLA